MFKVHPGLPGIIVDWFVTTLIKTPGHAPADTMASASAINQIRRPAESPRSRSNLLKRAAGRRRAVVPGNHGKHDGQDHMRAHELKAAVEVLKLVLLAYPQSADANETLAEAYVADGQKELARQHAAKALALLESHELPASSWTDTEQYRGEIRHGAEKILKQPTSNHN